MMYRETKGKTLEEIAAAFGDKVVLVEDAALVQEQLAIEDKLKPSMELVESRQEAARA